jgi:hypothetical protein
MNKDNIISAINKEISFCREHMDDQFTVTPEQAVWFIRGLEQALRIIQAGEGADHE